MSENLSLINQNEPEREQEQTKNKVGFNGLTPSEWASLSKNVWNDLSSPRNKYQLEHGAVFPLKLADRLIRIYSKKGDYILDPFAGIGTTLVAAQYAERNAFGTELNPKFAALAKQWIDEGKGLFEEHYTQEVYNDDCAQIATLFQHIKFQLTVTSPPYADFIHKSVADRAKTHKKSTIKIENNSTVKPYSSDERDLGNLPYKEFLVKLKTILEANYAVTKKGGYAAWVVKDYRDTKNKIPYVPFHSDLASLGQEVGFKYHDLIVWDQSGQRKLILLGYPSVFYSNQNCSFIVVFRRTD